jgi:acyl carrier protein
MVPMTIEDRVIGVLRKSLLLNAEQTISPDSHLIHDLNVTSLDRFELVMGLEEEFGIELSNEEQEEIHTVGDVVERVQRRCASSPVPTATDL